VKRIAFFVVGAALLAACDGGGEPGSCYRARDSACVAYDRAHAAAGKRMCQGFTWTAGEASCPRENRIGTCTRESGNVVEYMYSGPPNQLTPAIARTTCETAGGRYGSIE
jgi:hypothetical protein